MKQVRPRQGSQPNTHASVDKSVVTMKASLTTPAQIEKNPAQNTIDICSALTRESLRFLTMIHIGRAMRKMSIKIPQAENAHKTRAFRVSD